ncbi:MAG: hypothetical protein HY073_01315 [Deltaproteobacteria bacterium]|nr:hypothetical protein [Deltaproteobacteria bacterium]
MRQRFIFFLSFFLFWGCNEATLFKSVGNTLAAPVSLAVDVANLRAYVVNSNNNVEFTSATFSILDITNPAAPTLVSLSKNPISIPNFSGQIYYDAVARLAYVTNRLTTDVTAAPDKLLRINVNEAVAAFATVDSFTNGENPFGISCCDASGRIYSVGTAGTLNVFNPADLSTSVQVSLAGQLSTGEVFSGVNST